MTDKPLKKLQKKNKNVKFQKPVVKKEAIEDDSDISDAEQTGKAPKIDKKAIKMISSEVTDLLASLKREHGIGEDESIEVPIKKEKPEKGKKIKKEKKEAKNVLNPSADGGKKKTNLAAKKPEKNVAEEKVKSILKSKKQKKGKQNEGANNETTVGVTVTPQENSPTKNKKKKNKKRTANEAAVSEEDNEEPAVKVAKPNPNQNQKQKQKLDKPKQNAKKSKNADKEPSDKTDETKAHHLKNAVPVFVGNLPTNIKRLKLVKMFKKFGTILSIRFRTNTGKPFLRKAQISRTPFLIAFIYFDSREAAEATLALNGEKLGDRVLTVDLDSKDKAVKDPQNTVVVGNLKYAVTENILRDAFKCCGEIEYVRVVQAELGCKGVAFIRFAKPDSCALALKLNGTTILDREIRVEKFKQSKLDGGKKDKKLQKGKKPFTPKPGQKPGNKKNTDKTTELKDTNKQKENKKAKKNKEFLGLKSNDKKKALNKKNKKKKLSGPQLLAKKVAPKATKASE